MNLIGPQTLADRWDVPISWVYMKCRTRDLPHLKLGRYLRFDWDELQGWVAQHRRDVKTETLADIATTQVATPYTG
jgi:hypothetical protein